MPPRRGFKQRPSGSSAALEQALASASQAVSPGGGGVAGKKKAGRRHNVWESDAARPGGKTSMQVVLAWLTAEGNYARWASRSSAALESQKAEGQRKGGGGKRGQTRASLIREILGACEAEGIQRTMQDVRNRIANIEKQYAMARKWLRDTGFLLAFERGVADKDVERSVLRLCKYYRELAPRFQEVEAGRPAVTINLDNSTDDNEDAAAPRVRESSGGVSPAIDSDGGMDGEHQHEEEEEHGEQEVLIEESEDGEDEDEGEEAVAVAEQEEIAVASDASSTSRAGNDREEEEEAGSSSTSNRADNEEEEEEEEEEEPAQEAGPFEHAEESEEEEAEEHLTRREASKRGVSAQTPTPKRRRLALLPHSDLDDDGASVVDDNKNKAHHRAVLLAAAEEQREQRRELFELERAKLQRELELKEIQVAYEKTLARKKLQDAGVALDDIDRVLPL